MRNGGFMHGITRGGFCRNGGRMRAAALCVAAALIGIAIFCGGCGPAETPVITAETPAPTAAPTQEPAVTPTIAPTPEPTPVPVEAVAFVPDAFGERLVRVETTIAEDEPLALIDELVRLGTLPDIDYGRAPYFEVSDSYVKLKGGKQDPRVVARLDVSGRFLDALEDMSRQEELVCMQGFANTFITYYGAETFMLTVNGDKLETSVRDYESGLTFDQYVKTARED